jgi:hypothetical protein
MPPLPAPRGPAHAVLMLVNPRLLFLYWMTDAALTERLASLDGPAEVILESAGGAGGATDGPVARVPFDFRTGSWYLAIPVFEGTIRARLGASVRGRFVTLMQTNELEVPRTAPGKDPELWIDGRALRATGRTEPVPPPPATSRVERREEVAFEVVSTRAAQGTGSSPARAVWSRDDFSASRRLSVATSARPAAPALASRRPPGKAGVPPIGLAEPAGYLAFVLHAHLPFVRHPEREFFLEEGWLFEGITETDPRRPRSSRARAGAGAADNLGEPDARLHAA